MSRNLIDLLEICSEITCKGITTINGENNDNFISYNELFKKSLYFLYYLQVRGLKPGDELILWIDDNLSFICFFWACILGRIIPVPVTADKNDEHRLKLLRIFNSLNKPYLLTNEKMMSSLLKTSNKNFLEQIRKSTFLMEEIKNLNEYGTIYKPKSNEIAFIQFSSGSTGNPKGVILSHDNLLTNFNAIIKAAKITINDSTLSWMPLTHDMGLIGFHLVPLAVNLNQYIISTSSFIKHPLLWLKKASEYRSSLLCSPNFGYKFFLDHFNPEKGENIDLSSVRLIFNGAEPISAELCNRFCTIMAQYGLKKNPCFQFMEWQKPV